MIQIIKINIVNWSVYIVVVVQCRYSYNNIQSFGFVRQLLFLTTEDRSVT